MVVRLQAWSSVLACAIAFASAAAAQVRLAETHRIVPSTSAWPEAAAAADFDGDGDVDIVSGASERLGAGAVLSNVGQRFVRSTTCSDQVASFTRAVSVDVDGDGDLDLATNAGLQINQGGCFVDAAASLPAVPDLSGVSLAAGDVDGDGDIDLVRGVPRWYCDNPVEPCPPSAVTLWINQGPAGFAAATPQVPAEAADQPIGLVLADFDGDLDLDLYVGGGIFESQWGPHRLLLNDGAALFTDVSGQLPPNPVSSGCHSIHAVDLDRDGDLDILVGASELYLNDGAASFVDASASLPGGCGCDVGDLGGDGDLDVVAIGGAGLLVLENDGAGALTQAPSALPPFYGRDVELADYDGDGDLDAFVVGEGFGDVLFQDDAGRLVALAPNVPLPPGAEPPVRFAVGDLDGDHDLDLYAVSRDQDRLYLDDGSGAFVESSLPADADWSTDVELADADGDGDLDAWIANRGSASSERLMLNDGHAGFSASTWTTSADASAAIAVGDLDGDGDLDVITGNTNASNKVYLNDGASHWIETPSSWPSVYGAYSIALADGDGDGDLDVFLSDGWLRYFPNDGAAVFTQAPPFVFTSLPGVERVAAGDIDGDGDSDVVGSIAGGIYVEKSFGAYFQLAPGALSSSSGTSLELADVDADGDLDALVTSPLAVFLNDGDGVFTDAIPGVPLVTYAASSATSDLDGDGDADVLVARSGRPLLLTNLARQLAWRTPPAIGRTLELVLRGPAGEPFVLVASHGQVYLPFGSAGVLKIDRSQLALRRYGHLDAHGRAVVTQDVAGDPSLAGTSLYWQALIANPRRLTNLEITTFADL